MTNLNRMRQSGWFDILMLFLIAALVFGILGGVGTILYNQKTAAIAPDVTAYEMQQSLGVLSGSKGTFVTLAVIFAIAAVVGLFCLRFISPWIHASLHRQLVARKTKVVCQYAGAILVSAIMLFPVYWMVISALKTSDELLRPVPTLWPMDFQWGANFAAVLKRAPFGRYFFNTIVSTFFIMIFQMGIGVFAAYGFSKGRFKGQNGMFLLVLGALMIPIQVTFVPIYVMIAKLSWLNTFYALIVPNLVSAYFIFMLRQTFMSVDNSYLDAGKVDGMGRIGSIFYVLCPMCQPTLITVGIITFINGWNSYFWPKMVTTKDTRRTIAVGVNHLRSTFAGVEVANYHEIMAGAVLAVLPIVILFLFLQKYIMTGMSKAAMK